MTFASVNVNDVQQALSDMLRNWSALQDIASLTIENAERVNDSENNCPWIGIYCVGVEYPGRTIGMGQGMRYQRMQFWIVCQQQSTNSGMECAQRLEQLVQAANSAVLSDTSLGGTVDAVDEFRTEYPQWGKSAGGVYMQTAVTQFTAVTTVRAS